MEVIRNFETYENMEKAHREDVNNFPMVYMFGPKTDKEILECISKIGAMSLDDCIGNGVGGLILKADEQKYLDMFRLHRQERELFSSTDEGLYRMILSEMYNHEYGYTTNPEDTLMALGKEYSDLETDIRFNRAWAKAQKECFRIFNENQGDAEGGE